MKLLELIRQFRPYLKDVLIESKLHPSRPRPRASITVDGANTDISIILALTSSVIYIDDFDLNINVIWRNYSNQ